MAHTTLLPVFLLLLGATLMPVHAQEQPATHELPMSATLGFERIHLPGSESVGLTGGTVVFEVADGWWAGPAVYGAATGDRGGFFVGGLELQRRWALAPRWQLLTGLYAGGGGGGGAPVGGGLMLRPALSVLRDFGGWQAGLTASYVTFPSGDIRSSQVGVLLAWDGRYRYVDASLAGQEVEGAQRSGFGFDQWLGTVGEYRLRDGSSRSFHLVGTRVERHDGSGLWHWGIEAAAAASGDAAGYMEVLGGGGVEVKLLPSLSIGARAALGLGGGGGVPSGGGLIAKGAATLAWRFTPGWQAGIEAGLVDGLHGQPRANTAQIWLAADLEPPRPAGDGLVSARVSRFDWVAGVQHIDHATRKDGSSGSLDTVGIKLDRQVGELFYLTAQAHSAFAGGAGAYSVGLVGLGIASPASRGRWQVGAEALAGAAGGGGVATEGGAIGQALLWSGLRLGSQGQLRLGVGKVRSVHGNGLDSPLVELSWSQAFGLTGR
jgi:hypothetical protein